MIITLSGFTLQILYHVCYPQKVFKNLHLSNNLTVKVSLSFRIPVEQVTPIVAARHFSHQLLENQYWLYYTMLP